MCLQSPSMGHATGVSNSSFFPFSPFQGVLHKFVFHLALPVATDPILINIDNVPEYLGHHVSSSIFLMTVFLSVVSLIEFHTIQFILEPPYLPIKMALTAQSENRSPRLSNPCCTSHVFSLFPQR